MINLLMVLRAYLKSTIKIKNGTGGASPGTLSQGELALNIDNGLMYFGSRIFK